LEYKFRTTNIYANITQAYRPVLFSDLTPPAVTDVIDPNLEDASGFNADLGFRGTFKNYLNFDFSLFYLSYNNRIVGVRQFINNDPTQGTFLYRTNLGESVNKGIEGFFNLNITRLFEVEKPYGNLDLFASISFIDSRYTDFSIFSASGTAPNVTITETNLSGNRVENAPRYIHNFGLSWGNNNLSATMQYRMSGRIFTDANNTVTPSTNGVTGLLDRYGVFDLSSEYKFMKNFNIRAGINNLLSEEYATRRAGGYPGPGIIPGEGRTFYISIGAKL
jgi:Fe(3+) dicitrate transport protein